MCGGRTSRIAPDRSSRKPFFGAPDETDDASLGIAEDAAHGGLRTKARVKGVDVFRPQSGEVRSDGPDGIACWFLDTVYNEESFFARHAYFLGANDPYGSLKTTLKAEINREAWDTLNSDTSRPYSRNRSRAALQSRSSIILETR